MDGSPTVLLLLLMLTAFGACDWLRVKRKQGADGGREAQFEGLSGQRLREVLARKDSDLLWNRGAPHRLLLYCTVGNGLHLKILSGGEVRGVHIPDNFCWLKVCSLRPGVVGIQGLKSKLFLCMNDSGQVYTAEKLSDECHLRERMEENHYNTYSSARYPGLYLGLSQQGHTKRGTSVNPRRPHAHFLPRRKCPMLEDTSDSGGHD